ncbi:uncharacterized protein LOC5563604 [Aedes aegypti]|uniref:Ionotropic glutamate receptor C-terminal domain-containing protein n=1 Tax=Aedes aegypti TaxID=7159 RepID=A0A1S4G7S9_AEDAE|nr:uncharacterized protein LOC5563604 [Aedes aegypti]
MEMVLRRHLNTIANTISQARLVHRIAISYFLGVHSICRVINRTDLSVNIPLNDLPLVIIHPQVGMFQAINLGCSAFIIDENIVLWFLNEFIPAHDMADYRIATKYFIVMIHSSNDDQKTTLENIQSHPVLEEISNLLLVVQKNATFELLTHRYVGSRPTSLEYQLLDRYDGDNESFIYGRDLFLDKGTNLLGKTFRVACFHLVPWIIMRQGNNGVFKYLNQAYTVDGLDGYLLTQFCLRYNCTWELHVDQKNQYGNVFDNGTGNGMFGALLDRKVDFAMGAVGGYYGTFKYFSLSDVIQWIGVTCLVPKPGLVPNWQLIYIIFSTSVWITLGAIFITVSICLHIFKSTTIPRTNQGFSWILLKVLRTFVLTSADIPTNTAAEVTTVTALLMFTIIIGNVYIGKIHSILAIPPYEAPIATVLDLAKAGIQVNAPHAAWMYALDLSENEKDKTILKNFHVPTIERFTDITDGGQEATMVGLLENGHIMVGNWINARNVELYRIMSEPLYFEYEAGYATKTWPLLDHFNYLAAQIRDACLLRYIELLEVDRYMDHFVQVSIEHSWDRPHSALKDMNVEEISGALMLLGMGCAVSLVIFILELVYHRYSYCLQQSRLRK